MNDGKLSVRKRRDVRERMEEGGAYVRDGAVQDQIGVNAVRKMGEQLCRFSFFFSFFLCPAGRVKHRWQRC